MAEYSNLESSEKIFFNSNLQIIFGVTVTTAIGIFSLSPAFPRIVKELQISPKDIGLLITVFTFPGILLMPVMGVIADLFGRKKVLVPALALFALAGGLCLFVNDFKMLLVLRFFQGIGVAPLSSLNVTVIGDLYAGKKRTAAMGYNQSVFSVGAAGLSTVGGALAMMGWHYPFFLPLMAIPVGLLVMFFLKSPTPEVKNVKRFKEYIWGVTETIKKGQIIAIYSVTIVIFIIVAGSYATYFPLLMGITFNAPPLIIGIVMSSVYIASALSSSQMGKIIQRFPEKAVIRASFLLYALALVIVPFMHNTWLFFIPALLLGVAQGISLPTIQTLLGSLSSNENRAIIMSFYGTALRLGQTLGPPLLGIVFAIFGINAAFYASSCLALAAFGLIFVMIK
ncbi:MAG: MFS transporter [Deltaproteobacteria bacterium]|nr:MFS transporter [Deltaproteobacteria bacterium]